LVESGSLLVSSHTIHVCTHVRINININTGKNIGKNTGENIGENIGTKTLAKTLEQNHWQTLQVDPDADPDGDGASAALPRTKDDEFRPFVRRLPEFKFWLAASRAVLVALVMTLTALFDVPVFWPILLVYFIVLFLLTMKRQVLHMVRHRYVPFTTGKKVYSAGGKGDK
jgi:hypothetical protein